MRHAKINQDECDKINITRYWDKQYLIDKDSLRSGEDSTATTTVRIYADGSRIDE